jgi:hypothetical protein
MRGVLLTILLAPQGVLISQNTPLEGSTSIYTKCGSLSDDLRYYHWYGIGSCVCMLLTMLSTIHHNVMQESSALSVPTSAINDNIWSGKIHPLLVLECCI